MARQQSFVKWAKVVLSALDDPDRPLKPCEDDAEISPGEYLLMRVRAGGDELVIDKEELKLPEPGCEYVFAWQDNNEEEPHEIRCLAPTKGTLDRVREDRTNPALPQGVAMHAISAGYQGLLEAQKAVLQPIADSVPSLVDRIVELTAENAHLRSDNEELHAAQGPILSPEITDALSTLIREQGPTLLVEFMGILRDRLKAPPRRRRAPRQVSSAETG